MQSDVLRSHELAFTTSQLRPVTMSRMSHDDRWVGSTLASGVQVVDRMIRSSPSLWNIVTNVASCVQSSWTSDVNEDCIKVASYASIALASPCTVEIITHRMGLMKKWREQLAHLMKDPGIEQRTPAWYAARQELTTASDVSAAIGGKGGSNKDFLVKKAGDPEEQRTFNGCAPPLKWGVMFEPVANAIYSKRLGVNVHEFGLLRHPTISHIGASPDGITDMGVMLEIKCPYSRIIDGTVPSAYVAQIQCQLDVCGLDECDFFQCEFEEVPYSTTGTPLELDDNGCEHGSIVEHWDQVTSSFAYDYCPMIGDNSLHDFELREKWADEVISKAKSNDVETIFTIRRWRLRCLDIVRVHRDPSYILRMNAGLKIAWDRILRYRSDREAYKRDVLGIGGTKKAQPTSCIASSPTAGKDSIISGYAFVDDN